MLAPLSEPTVASVFAPRTTIDADGTVEGYASLFGEIDQAREMVMKRGECRKRFSRVIIVVEPSWHASTISWPITTRHPRTFAHRSAPLRRAEAVVAHHQQPMSGENEESLSRIVLDSHLGSNGRIVFAADGVFRDGDRVGL